MAIKCLWIDDELHKDDALLRLLELKGVRSEVSRSGEEGLARAQAACWDAVLIDLRLPDVFGITLLDRLVKVGFSKTIVLTTAYYLEPELRIDALRRGAAGFVYKPILDTDELIRLLRSVAELREHAGIDRSAIRDPISRHGVVAASPAMRAIVEWVESIAPRSSTVLITGETGTGKERVARALHLAGPRRNAPFVAVNCATLPEGLAEAELFGHRKGAFTGAVADHQGVFAAAHGGTLFLDEVGELPLRTQAQLLRTLDTGEVRRVGEVGTRDVDARVVAATNRQLYEETVVGRFRADLYYRLAVAHCSIPPLRERLDDMEALLSAWLVELSDGRVLGANPDAIGVLRAHTWPGNLRELRNVCERALITAPGPVLNATEVASALAGPVDHHGSSNQSLSNEARRLLTVLEQHKWNRTEAARSLGVDRTTLWRRLVRAHLTERPLAHAQPSKRKHTR
jgi:two-component system response regulator AtoC